MNIITGAALLLTLAPAALTQNGGTAAPASAAPDAPSAAMEMVVKPAGSQPSAKGPVQYFTGSVRVDPLCGKHPPSTAAGGGVTFEPAARSARHAHPAGQVLILTAGVGRIQQWGATVRQIRAGDVIWTPPGVKIGTALRAPPP